MDYGLKDKVVLVTGSTKGLGKAIAELIAQEGGIPVVTGRREKEVHKIMMELREKYQDERIQGYCVDFSELSSVDFIFDVIKKDLGSIDVLINNAGIWPTAYVVDMKPEDFERTSRVNLEVPYLLCQKFVQEKIAAQQKGKIVNIVSQAAFHGSTTGHAHYAASKAGLVSFSISLAREVAKYRINVNMVAPGMVRTPMTEEALKAKPDYYNGRIPIGRVAEPEEVAQAAVFLASKCADYYTGITFDATGGMLMR